MWSVCRADDRNRPRNGGRHEAGAQDPLTDTTNNQATEHQHQCNGEGGDDDQPDATNESATNHAIKYQHFLTDAWRIPEESAASQGMGDVGPGEGPGNQPEKPLRKGALENAGYDNGGG